ncbi:MAG: hypothetical protein NTY69_10790 [Methylococcales bacterium]|nr:hypothetical protein [Methylococcales bacterium]
MMKTLISITLAIILLTFAYFKLPHFNFRLLDKKTYTSDTSQWVSLKGKDEFIISELTTAETFEKHDIYKVPNTDIVTGRKDSSISLIASYKYHIKLSELKYTLEDDALVFHVPHLYLSTPTFDTATLKRICIPTGIATCGDTLDNFMKEISAKLDEKGHKLLNSFYETSAKSLADDFDAFIKNNNKDILYKNIVVIFDNEPNSSKRMFNYNKSYCGNEPCAIELPLNNGSVLTIH